MKEENILDQIKFNIGNHKFSKDIENIFLKLEQLGFYFCYNDEENNFYFNKSFGEDKNYITVQIAIFDGSFKCRHSVEARKGDSSRKSYFDWDKTEHLMACIIFRNDLNAII